MIPTVILIGMVGGMTIVSKSNPFLAMTNGLTMPANLIAKKEYETNVTIAKNNIAL